MKTKYKPKETNAGTLRTPVTFYEYAPDTGPEPGESQKAILYECYAEIYNPSMKDIQIMEVRETKEAVTLLIRDTKGEYIPTNKHFVTIHDYRYVNKVFNVLDVRPDLSNNDFITILAGLYS
ncbi:phage head-tail adapter protein [Lacrimispora indolis]|uniref:phage head-tail adapter protein n=1 Tax=Lacrimispora indolis TaxID=69825 RepID=UPI0004629372|nr:phage head-tail adapter protein [[Clostridium] methoxybenzovorans]